MKAIIIDRAPQDAPKDPEEISITPGSAILMPGRGPLFLPDWCPDWKAAPSVALRICRLGRSVAECFAHRYFDAVAAALLVRPLDSSLAPGLVAAFDGALALGKWIEMPSQPFDINAGESAIRFSPDIFPSLISLVSKYMTLQQGDVLIPAVPDLWRPLLPDDRVSISVGSLSSLDLKIK